MIYIFTALYCEAHIFIRQFKLIKNQENTCYQEFYNEACGIRLTVTGAGEIAAAAAVGSAFTAYRPAPEDWLINVGICAHPTQQNGIFLCSKIIEQATGKTFYPDMLYSHNFREETIMTKMLPYNNDNNSTAAQPCAEMLYDMEAAAIYQTGIRFVGPHQMQFLKIVSDNGVINDTANGAIKDVSGKQIIQLMENYQDCIFAYMNQLSAITQELTCRNNPLCSEDKSLIDTFCTDLHCSKAMRDSMLQYIRYLSLSGRDYRALIRDMYQKGLLPCKDKREGKQRFEEFKQRLF